MKDTASFLCLLLITSTVFNTVSAQSGIAATLSIGGIQFFSNDAFNTLLPQLQHLNLPDIPYTKFSCLGKCYFETSNSQLETITCNPPSLSLRPGAGITASLSNCASTFTSHWRVKRTTFPGFSCSGTIDGSFSGISISVNVDLTTNNGEVGLHVSSASVHMSSDNLKFHHGSCDLITDILKKTIENAVKKAVNDQLSGQLPGILNGILGKYTLPKSIPLPDGKTTLLIPVSGQPTITNNIISIPLRGEFIINNGPKFKDPVPEISPPSGAPQMVELALTSYLFDSLSFALFQENVLYLKKNVTLLGFNFDVILEATKPPKTKISGKNINVKKSEFIGPNGDVVLGIEGAFIATLQANPQIGFEIDISSEVEVQVFVDKQTLSGSITNFTVTNLTLGFANSTIGPIDLHLFASWFSSFVDSYVIPEVNKYLQKGVELPVFKGVGFHDAKIVGERNVLRVDTDFVHMSSKKPKQLD